MNLASLKVGDVVRVEKKGRQFYALVRDAEPDELPPQASNTRSGYVPILPLDRRNTYYWATAREINAIFHANKETRRRMEHHSSDARRNVD